MYWSIYQHRSTICSLQFVLCYLHTHPCHRATSNREHGPLFRFTGADLSKKTNCCTCALRRAHVRIAQDDAIIIIDLEHATVFFCFFSKSRSRLHPICVEKSTVFRAFQRNAFPQKKTCDGLRSKAWYNEFPTYMKQKTVPKTYLKRATPERVIILILYGQPSVFG